MDIAQNSIRARATRVEIDVEERPARDTLVITVRDNGHGMDADTLARVTDPFFTSRTTRRVGLGIPLLLQNARATGGDVTVRSTPGEGTTVEATFTLSHLDRPPAGDIPATVVLLAAANPAVDVRYRHATARGEYSFSSRDASDALDGLPLDHPDVVAALREMIAGNIRELK
jgi:hypothetical protein